MQLFRGNAPQEFPLLTFRGSATTANRCSFGPLKEIHSSGDAGFLFAPTAKITSLAYAMKNPFSLLLCFLLLAGVISAMQKATHDSAKAKPDACAVLTKADVQKVQGDPVQEIKTSTPPSSGLAMSQCIFRTANPSKSVSVAIASQGSTSPRAFWQKQFPAKSSSEDEAEKKQPASKGGKTEEDEESTQPRKIAGVGEQAYWVGSPMVGALYVLKGDNFLRISVGGLREEPARLQKSIALARLALKRM